ncbi:MAG: hypothetical protein ABR953_08885 [Candidatus Acidiferrales bacterium]|jgi:hypothetical protein
MKKQIVRLALGSALAIAFTLPIGHVTFGDPTDDCHKRLEADRARIDRDAAKHGEHSPQVDRDVARMDNDRQWCRDHHADWDHDRLDVGIYIKH